MKESPDPLFESKEKCILKKKAYKLNGITIKQSALAKKCLMT